jgi:hypothetical protein
MAKRLGDVVWHAARHDETGAVMSVWVVGQDVTAEDHEVVFRFLDEGELSSDQQCFWLGVWTQWFSQMGRDGASFDPPLGWFPCGHGDMSMRDFGVLRRGHGGDQRPIKTFGARV